MSFEVWMKKIFESVRVEELDRLSIDRHIALGIHEYGDGDCQAWFIFNLSSVGRGEIVTIRMMDVSIGLNDELHAELAIGATLDTWLKIGRGGHSAAVAACDEKRISITGKLAYFIRNVRSSVDLIVAFGQAVSACSTVP